MNKAKKLFSKYALLSVYYKDGIVELAKSLLKNKYSIISTGGTAKILKAAKIPVLPIEKITGSPEAFDGRMKTISFQVGSGILYDRKNKNHRQQAKKLKVPNIEIVVCNLYPFDQAAADPKSLVSNLIEMIDIGGPTMIRAAAKNFQSVAVVVDPNDYKPVIKELSKGKKISLETRRYLAIKAFGITADYDGYIHQVLSERLDGERNIRLFLEKGTALRYGENPHQKGYFFQTRNKDPFSLANFHQLQGKELSFNNLLDCNAAINDLAEINNKQAACVIIKHGNPCGAARDKTITKAFLRAWNSDPLAAFGSIIALNKPVSASLAQIMIKDNRFFEVLLVPELTAEAKKIFAKKKNLRVLINQQMSNPQLSDLPDYKKIRGGFLVQENDTALIAKKDLKTVTKTKPTSKQIQELLFAWSVCRCCKSNSIVITKDQMLQGAGVGQQDRMRCCQLAVSKAEKRAEGAVAASDAFFPFADGPEILIKTGVKAIIQPGGSLNDKQVIDLCNKNKICMVFTGIRCFKH